MTLCTRSVCLASSGRLAEERGACCGAGERDEPVSNTQPVVVIPASIKTAIVRRILIASLSSDQLAATIALVGRPTLELGQDDDFVDNPPLWCDCYSAANGSACIKYPTAPLQRRSAPALYWI